MSWTNVICCLGVSVILGATLVAVAWLDPYRRNDRVDEE